MPAQFLNASGRDFQIYGGVLVQVQGGLHLSGHAITSGAELGLTLDSVKIRHRYLKKPIYVDDYGRETPVEIMTQGGWVDLHMQLSHYDRVLLDLLWNEANGGPPPKFITINGVANTRIPDGTLLPAGTTLGHGLPLYASGCHYFTTYIQPTNYSSPAANPNIVNQIGNANLIYAACYLPTEPLEIPMGSKASIVDLTIRCIPYKVVNPNTSLTNVVGEILASGQAIWKTTFGPYPGV